MKHPNVAVLEKIYSAYAQGDFDSVLAACSDSVTFQIQGKSKLAGKYTKENLVQDFATKLRELSGGTYRIETHDILASDLHAAVITSNKLRRGGKDHEYRSVHIWRFESGKPLAWYEYPRDLYAFDTIWS